MKIKLSKTLLESSLIFQAKNDVRYYLNGICIKSDGRVASTDGHRAFVGTGHENKMKEDIILKISKSPTKKYDHVICDIKTGIVEYIDWVGHRIGVGLCEIVDGRFPDIDRVIPKETAAVDRIGFNAGYLADVEKVAKIFNPKWESVVFEFDGTSKASVANLKSPYGETAKIIVMPMRIY